eukprot:8690-Eustigmatos_ZCMA.PRE.1
MEMGDRMELTQDGMEVRMRREGGFPGFSFGDKVRCRVRSSWFPVQLVSFTTPVEAPAGRQASSSSISS